MGKLLSQPAKSGFSWKPKQDPFQNPILLMPALFLVSNHFKPAHKNLEAT